MFAVYLGFGLHYALYSPELSNNFIWGAYHVHTTMSDGLLDPIQIADQARQARDGFVVLTDHGNPNQDASAFNAEIEGVRFIGGSEVGLPEGHFTFFAAKSISHDILPSHPPSAMDDVRKWGGVSVLAYPSSPRTQWQYWNSDLHPAGIEAMSLFTQLLQSTLLQRARLILFAPFSRYQFLTVMRQPGKSFARWDEFLRRSKTWGFVATDAHGGFHVKELKQLTLNFPSYQTAFSIAAIGIAPEYAAHPEEALRRGDFFNCVRGAAEPQRFDFYASRGDDRFPMGADAPLGSSLHIRLRTIRQRTQLIVKRDGAVIATTASGFIDLHDVPPGVYRVEAYLPAHPLLPPGVPWIFSNPIFVGGDSRLATEVAIAESTPGTPAITDSSRLARRNPQHPHLSVKMAALKPQR